MRAAKQAALDAALEQLDELVMRQGWEFPDALMKVCSATGVDSTALTEAYDEMCFNLAQAMDGGEDCLAAGYAG